MSGYEWMPCDNFSMPAGAVSCGKDQDGSDIYVGLTHHQADELPVKIVPRRREAYVSYNGKEVKVSHFSVLCERKMHWVSSGHGSVPPGAIPAGRTASGETLYVGRTRMGHAFVMGKVHGSHGCLYVPFAGKEVGHKTYEVLVLK